MNWRAGARHLVENALTLSGIVRLARGRMVGRTLVLAYHNIVPRDERAAGDLSLHLPQQAFATQLDMLLETHDIVALDDAGAGGTGGRPRVAITFDDAYAGAMTAGIEELRRRGLPATVFVTPAFVGGEAFWWDRIASPDSGLSDDVREQALGPCRGEHERVLAWARAAGLRTHDLPQHAHCATERDLAAAAATAGISIGSHTWSHANLAAVDDATLRSELQRARDWLDARFPASRRWFSYPYGRRNPAAESAALAHGHAGAFLIEGGWMPTGVETPSRLPRLNIPAGLSANGFAIRAAGLLSR